MRTALPRRDNAGDSETCGKGTCQVCDHIITTITLTAKAWDAEFVMKQSSVFGLIIITVNTDLFEKEDNVPRKRFHPHYIQDCHKGIDDWEVTLFEKCETHKQHE